MAMAITTGVIQSYYYSQLKVGIRGTWSLNPEAPEFFPENTSVPIPDPNYLPISSPPNPPFLPCLIPPYPYNDHYAPLSLVFSQSPYSYSVYCHHQFAAATAVPVTQQAGSSLFEQAACKSVNMVPEEAQDPIVDVVHKKGTQPRKNKHHKHSWSSISKRYVKKDFVRTDSFSQASKKEWKAKSKLITESEDNKLHFVRNAPDHQASFEHPKKVKAAGCAVIKKREKHPPIPLKYDGKETTVMIRNIPNRYTREMLKDILDQHCLVTNKEEESQTQNTGAVDKELSLSEFDFLYLPIDFVTKSNKGYAFVNFTKPEAARKFFDAWHNKHWDTFRSKKICEIYCAKLQGIEQLVKHFEKMEFPSEDFQPLSFDPARDGCKQLVKETVVGRCTQSGSSL